jgi:hypothetical protein
MPGDLIPYKLLSLYVVIFILNSFYLRKAPVLKIAGAWGFSYQFIYSVIYTFRISLQVIYQHFRELSKTPVPPGLGEAAVFGLIRKPYMEFQYDYVKLNKRPCFMVKFFYKAGAPPAGLLTTGPPPGGRQHNP